MLSNTLRGSDLKEPDGLFSQTKAVYVSVAIAAAASSHNRFFFYFSVTRWQAKRNCALLKEQKKKEIKKEEEVCFVHGIPWCFPKRNAQHAPQLTATEIPHRPQRQINKQTNK